MELYIVTGKNGKVYDVWTSWKDAKGQAEINKVVYRDLCSIEIRKLKAFYSPKMEG